MAKGLERRDVRITLRIPHALREVLEREAAAEMRSLTDVIVLCLHRAFGSPTASVLTRTANSPKIARSDPKRSDAKRAKSTSKKGTR